MFLFTTFQTTPLDSSIFGEYETALLKKVVDFLTPTFARKQTWRREKETFTFDDLLRYNQKLMMERITEEIERAERYHHAFIITIFKINGLKDLCNVAHHTALNLINELSMGIRRQVRKTDFFSWTEADLFTVLSVEGYQRMGFLERRIMDFIAQKLKEKGYYDATSFYPVNGYAVFPGKSSTAAELVHEAKARIESRP